MTEGAQNRMTKPRQDVLDILRTADRPLGAYDIIDRMTPRPKPPTVYRALDYLAQSDLIHRVESLNAYMACQTRHTCCEQHFGYHHPHTTQFAVCEKCGRVEEISTPTSAIPQNLANGFVARRITTEILGHCGQCAR